jgi:hypothetical protein
MYSRVAAIKSEEPRALQGQAVSQYMLGNFREGDAVAEKLLAAGASFSFPIAHFHAMTTCVGTLTVQRGKIAYTGGKDDGFEVGPTDFIGVDVRNLSKGLMANEKLPDYPVLVVRWRGPKGKENSYQMLPYQFSQNPNMSGKNFTSAFPMDSSDVSRMRGFEQSVFSLILKYVK